MARNMNFNYAEAPAQDARLTFRRLVTLIFAAVLIGALMGLVMAH